MLDLMTYIGVTTDEALDKCFMRVKESLVNVRTGENLTMCYDK